jgi:acyl carrier protein
MTDSEKIEALKEAIRAVLEKDVGDITQESKFETLGVDSLDAIELQMWLEDNKGVKTLDPKGAIKTVGDFLNLIP